MDPRARPGYLMQSHNKPLYSCLVIAKPLNRPYGVHEKTDPAPAAAAAVYMYMILKDSTAASGDTSWPLNLQVATAAR